MSNTREPERPEVLQVRRLMDRFVAANEKYMRPQLRIVALPYSLEFSQDVSSQKGRVVTIAIPTELKEAKKRRRGEKENVNAVLPIAAVDGCCRHEFWGVGGIKSSSGVSPWLFFVVWGGRESTAAISEFRRLAAAAGRLYQTMPAGRAPVHGTTSPRNLWVTVLFAWLQTTELIRVHEGFTSIPLPFSASAEAWRKILYGTKYLASLADLPEQVRDGIVPPNTINWNGATYRCELTRREMTFLEIALHGDETPLGNLVNLRNSAIWKQTFTNNKRTRNKVTQFLSRLNRKLAQTKPEIPFYFSLPRFSTSIHRIEAPPPH